MFLDHRLPQQLLSDILTQRWRNLATRALSGVSADLLAKFADQRLFAHRHNVRLLQTAGRGGKSACIRQRRRRGQDAASSARAMLMRGLWRARFSTNRVGFGTPHCARCRCFLPATILARPPGTIIAGKPFRMISISVAQTRSHRPASAFRPGGCGRASQQA